MKLAIILSGCGYLDGAEIRESVLTLLSLDQRKINYDIFAPDIEQFHVVSHLKSEESANQRNVLEESARIARGQIKSLSELNTSEYAGLILPGGFGVAKNLSSFAFDGNDCQVNPDIQKTMEEFKQALKPIGVICIAPAVLSTVFKNQNIELTIGDDESTANAINSAGNKHIVCKSSEAHVDKNHKVVSTPAYMFDDAKVSDVFTGIDALVCELQKLL